jgi:hypothetical protein
MDNEWQFCLGVEVNKRITGENTGSVEKGVLKLGTFMLRFSKDW